MDSKKNEDYQVPNEVQILINDNSDTYNHNISVRITDGKCEIHPEELSKIAIWFQKFIFGRI